MQYAKPNFSTDIKGKFLKLLQKVLKICAYLFLDQNCSASSQPLRSSVSGALQPVLFLVSGPP